MSLHTHTVSIHPVTELAQLIPTHTYAQRHTSSERKTDFSKKLLTYRTQLCPLTNYYYNLSESTINPPHILSLSLLLLSCAHIKTHTDTPHLSAPEFDGPVEGGRDEEVGKVDSAHCAVAADARHRPLVALEHLADTRLTEEGGHKFDIHNYTIQLCGVLVVLTCKYKEVKWFAPCRGRSQKCSK